MVNITDCSRMTRNGRVFAPVQSRRDNVDTPAVGPVQIETNTRVPKDVEEDEIIKIIKKSEYKIVDQLLQMPSKISIMSLLLNSEAHRSSLMKILDQAMWSKTSQ